MFFVQFGNNCTRNRLNCTRLLLVQLAVARAKIPELHSKACDYLYKFHLFRANCGSRLEYHVHKYLYLLGNENEIRISNGS